MEIKINFWPLEFKQCKGQIVYKDGTTEPIISKREFGDQCEVRAPSGQYICFSDILTHDTGYKYKIYRFKCYDFERQEYYLVVDTIKEFQFMEENKQ